jgi:Protein kinase domain
LKGDGCSSEGDTLEDEAPLALPLSPQIQRAAPQLLQRPRLLTSPTRLGGNCGLQCSSSCPQTPVGMMRRTAPAGQPPRSPLGQLPACSVGCGSRTLLQQQQYHPRRSSLEGGRSHACSGGEQPGAGLRIALARLDFAQASARAARLVDRLASGLGRVASLLPDGVLRQPVGREVMRDWEFVGPQLGVGSSCVTRLVLARSDGSPAACKSISKTCLSRSAAARAAVLGMQRELAILQHTIGHPHVVQLRRVYEDARALHLVLEWCGGGCLEAALDVAPSGRLPEASAAAVMVAVLEVLALCHERCALNHNTPPLSLLGTHFLLFSSSPPSPHTHARICHQFPCWYTLVFNVQYVVSTYVVLVSITCVYTCRC